MGEGRLDLTLKFTMVYLLGLATLLLSQQLDTSISGTLRDDSGAPLPGAAVSIQNVETGAQRKLATDGNGRYSAPSVAVGRYQVSASREGFQSERKTGIEVVFGQRVVVDLRLAVGELRQTLTVEAAPSPVNLSTQQISGLVSEREVKELPLNGRSYDQLVTLSPGIVNYTAERSGGIGTSSSSVGNMFAVSGRRPQENLFLLNGVEYTGASVINNTPGGTSGQLLGVDAVREFNVATDTYGAEYGKRPGAQVSIVTASGTNELHGTLYTFLRNSALDARNFFDQGAIPPFERSSLGGALGGPIKKDRLFLLATMKPSANTSAKARLRSCPIGTRAREGSAASQSAWLPAWRRCLRYGRTRTVPDSAVVSLKLSAIRSKPSARISEPRGWILTLPPKTRSRACTRSTIALPAPLRRIP